MKTNPVDDSRSVPMALPWFKRTWNRTPEWAKIGLRAALLIFVIDIALGIRIWYGLQDPPEVAAIRGSGRHIIIPAIDFDFNNPLNWFEAASVGVWGTSGKDVTAVRLDEHATDQLVLHIAKNFPNVQTLYFSNGNISTASLLHLKDCRQIHALDVSDTEIGDRLRELLPQLPKLRTLIARNTNLSDIFTIACAKHEALEYCSIEGTDITPEAVEVWKASRKNVHIQTDFDRCILRGVIRWSDGEISRRFRGTYEICFYGPQRTDDASIWSRRTTFTSDELRANRMCWSPQDFENEQDGTYQIQLKLGSVAAEPAVFTVKDHIPSPRRLEFHTLVPRAEAERMAESEDRQ